MFTVVMNGSDLIQTNPHLIQSFSHPSRVGINNLPNQKFITDGYYFCFHCGMYIVPTRCKQLEKSY